MHPPDQAVHPLCGFSIKTQYLFQKERSSANGRGIFLFGKTYVGFEPEGTWQHAGGMLQPEVASAAAEVESLRLDQKCLMSEQRKQPFILS